MNKYLLIIAIFLFGCSNSDVSVTQTGNPPKLSIGISIYSDTTSFYISRDTVKRFDTINSINITSAIFVVDEIELKGTIDTIEFENDEPFIIDLALDSSTVMLDTTEAKVGQLFETIELSVSSLTSELSFSIYDSLEELRELSFLIKGFVNGDSSNVFKFESPREEDIEMNLSNPISIIGNTQKNMIMVLDIDKWFIDSTGSILNPFLLENKTQIEESILGSIHEEHEEEESEED